MQSGRTANTLVLIAALSAALLSFEPLDADQAVVPAPAEDSVRVTNVNDWASWKDFVTLEVGEDELVLTNVSDRPIVAWTVRQVTRITEGNEGYGSITVDAADYPLIPGGYDELLLPGESVTLERPAEPWIRPDLKGPEYLVYYDVGALVFENSDWVGAPKFADRIFEGRLKAAERALVALEVIAAGSENLNGLPERYRRRLSEFPSREDALRTIQEEARQSLEVMVSSLRPEDLAKLPRLKERLR
jgi:hypothetical protein